jgi:hypothetical protein
MFPSFLAWLAGSAWATRLGFVVVAGTLVVIGGQVAGRAIELGPAAHSTAAAVPVLVPSLLALPALTAALHR